LFRNDINGLRAVAVIAVVLFHFNPVWLPGGFAGVDVFFVISGYLMAGIIFNNIDSGKFSIVDFYIARANRIVPALAALCLFLLIFGWFFITPYEYRALGKHVASSIGFVSNFVYLFESGYFDAASHEKWLLHTWSLSVEWQFYLLFPLIVLMLSKFLTISVLRKVLLFGTFLCFLFSLYASYVWPNAAYYLLPSRAWEMLIGSLAFIYPWKLSRAHRSVVEVLGVGMILSAFILASANSVWPGYMALLPVLGSYLVVQAGNNESYITNNPIFQKLGLWSYSIYLWHWPLVVLFGYLALPEMFLYFGVLTSIVLGFLSYRFIESVNFRVVVKKAIHLFSFAPAYMMLLIAIAGSAVYLGAGFQWHYPLDVVIANNEQNNRNPYHCMSQSKFPCLAGSNENISAIVVGDSHADALFTSVVSVFDNESNGVVGLIKSSCPFLLGMKFMRASNCGEENERRIEYLLNNHQGVPLVWIARMSSYIYGQSDPARVNREADVQPSIYFSNKYFSVTPELLNELELSMLDTISRINTVHPVVIVLPTPEMRFNVPKVMSKELLLHDDFSFKGLSYSAYVERNKEVREIFERVAQKTNALILDPVLYLCDNQVCKAEIDGRPIYYDGDHMSESGNKLLSSMFANFFDTYALQ